MSAEGSSVKGSSQQSSTSFSKVKGGDPLFSGLGPLITGGLVNDTTPESLKRQPFAHNWLFTKISVSKMKMAVSFTNVSMGFIVWNIFSGCLHRRNVLKQLVHTRNDSYAVNARRGWKWMSKNVSCQ